MLSKSRVKYIQSLFHKKLRDAEGCFIVEGPKIITEYLLKLPSHVLSVYALESWIRDNQIPLQSINASAIFSIEVSDLEKISSRKTPNQVLAIIKKKESNPDFSTGLFLMLDSIQDPGNFGTILRTADWFGIHSIMCSPECADLYNPKVVQSTMGSIISINVWYTELIQWCRKNNHLPVYAATLHGISLYELSAPANGAILIGNESKGVHPDLLLLCRHQITIPRIGMAESLNAAVATGILLSHFTKP